MSSTASTTDYTYLTSELPGIGGSIKQRPDDFMVEEVSLYEPTGNGDHLYLFIEKTDLATTDAARILAKHFDVSQRDVGYAGLKDKRAVTRQLVSMEHVNDTLVSSFQHDKMQILWADRHTNKLKIGHLAANRFVIKIRDVDPLAILPAKRILDRLADEGVPNYVGEQRFGVFDNNHVLGKHLLKREWQAFVDGLLGGASEAGESYQIEARQAYDSGDLVTAANIWGSRNPNEQRALKRLIDGKSAETAVKSIPSKHRRFLISALQSWVFNRVLDDRIRSGGFLCLKQGDIATKHATGGQFLVEEPDVEQPRLVNCEISATGPMWGRKMKKPSHDVEAAELEMMRGCELSPEDFKEGQDRPDGTRRSLRMMMTDVDVAGGVDEHGAYIKVAFELPRGGFATTVLRELMKA